MLLNPFPDVPLGMPAYNANVHRLVVLIKDVRAAVYVKVL